MVSQNEVGKAMLKELKSSVKGFRPYRHWQLSLSKSDKLPRGKWFTGKTPGQPVVILDEFSEYHAQSRYIGKNYA